MSVDHIIAKTREYISIPSVIRFEDIFISYLADEFNLPGYEIQKEEGVLVLRKKVSRSNKIITAHIDRHGLVVNQDGEIEYATFNAKKHYNMEIKDSESLFQKIGTRFVGEPGYVYDSKGKPIETAKVKGFNVDFDRKDLLFTIDFLTGLPPNTPIAYYSPLSHKDGKISSQIDNVISVAVAYQLVKDGFDGTVIFATEEEIGRSWKHILNYLGKHEESTENLVVLDTTPYQDEDAIDSGLVVLRYSDEHGVFNPGLVDSIRGTCDSLGIRHQFKDRAIIQENLKRERQGLKRKKLGTTELGRIVENTHGEINGATIQIPTTNYHTNHETTSELALGNYYKLLTRILSR